MRGGLTESSAEPWELPNMLLFAGKYLAGFLSGSIAVMADAFNNLSDAGSSVITLLGFQFAGQAADEEHPFGHGRIEYLSGLAVSIAIIVMGVELGRSSIEKIIHPEAVDTGVLSMAILLASVAVKLYMSFYNRRIGAKIDRCHEGHGDGQFKRRSGHFHGSDLHADHEVYRGERGRLVRSPGGRLYPESRLRGGQGDVKSASGTGAGAGVY